MTKDKLFPVAQMISKITNQFYLAGGTAIMLKYDHRESYDLDFFYGKSFSFKRLGKRSDSNENSTSKISLICFREANQTRKFYPYGRKEVINLPVFSRFGKNHSNCQGVFQPGNP
ncbi:MAG: nucleotidyl transferase AbiEii/AbiGii toxin family protein [Bacteroidales bacterium]|nr:nucleotidyl transferase AbiEii/AbiGii toxin family protein [Bacteroidales bacterium]MCF8333874.1 nucleotidyl transferase AbiEii/AbiGii toxin family protein [Bacteroidales bacterium]